MISCDEYAIKALRYLDNDLERQELEDFLSHLNSCPGCEALVEAEKELSATLYRSRPLYSAPAALRDRVETCVVQDSTSSQVSIHPRAGRADGFLMQRRRLRPVVHAPV